jgi:ubiquinone/menaquinone biosynthesis C-methylase UbiE
MEKNGLSRIIIGLMIFDYIKKIAILFYIIRPRIFKLGYNQYKIYLIKKKINNIDFKAISYIDERIIEIPWIIKNLEKANNLDILDAGCTLNHSYIIKNILKKKNRITFVNLYKEKYENHRLGINYLESDIANLSIKDNSFDIVTCVSVLEHMGFNNQIYNNFNKKISNFLTDKNLYIKGILEIKRVLKENGLAYFSFPFGKKKLFHNLQQFNHFDIDRIISIFQPSFYLVEFYKYFNNKNEWKKVSSSECKNLLPVFYEKNTVISANSIALITLRK